MSTSDSRKSASLNRRDLLRISAAAGIGLAVSKPDAAMDSTKTAAHQEPGNCSYSAERHRQHAIRQSARLSWMAAFSPSKAFLTARTRRRKPLAAGQAAQAVEGRVPRADLRRQLPAKPAQLHRHRAVVSAGLGRRLHERRHAQAECLDAEPDRQAARSWCTSMAAATASARRMNCPRTKARRWRGITMLCRSPSITA